MRVEDRAEITQAGHEVRHCLFRLYRQTMDPLTGLIDGEVAACWGDYSPLISEAGAMWLFTAPIIETMPLAFFREARRDIARRLQSRSSLVSQIAEGYTAAIRFFGMLDFEIEAPIDGYHLIVCRRK